MSKMQDALTRSTVFIACTLFCATASASGIPGASFGYEQGNVVAPNPTGIAYNPGALGFSGTQLFLDVSLAIRDFTWTHARGQGDAAEPPGFEGANYGSAHARTIGAGPQFAATLQLGKLVIGGGWYVPYGGGTLRFDKNERFSSSMYPGAADSVARWHGFDASTSVIFATLGAALRFGPISFGAVGNLIVSSYGVTRAQNSPISGNDLTQEQRVYLEAKSINGSFGLGVMYEALPSRMWIGASYQAQPGLGEMSLNGKYTLDPMIGMDGPTRTQSVTLYQALPDIFRLGVRFKVTPEVELRLTGNYTRWSLSQTQCLGVRSMPCTVKRDGGTAPGSGVIKAMRRNWHDTMKVHAGVSYWVIEPLELFFGLSYENSAVPDSTLDPLVADADRVTAALGGRVRLADTWFVALSYNHQFIATRDNTRLSQLAASNIQTTSQSVDGGGVYEQWWATLNLNVAKIF
jgi:long-chain fatty acid transport protein